MMDKAYDLKNLAERLKKTGLPALKEVAEAEALAIYQETKAWLKESAIVSPNKLDDVGMPFVDQLDAIVLPQIDKIDGEVG